MFNLAHRHFFLMIFMFFLVVSCSSDNLSSSDTIDKKNVITLVQEETNDYAPVDEIEMMIVETFPVQVNVIAKGYFNDDCTKIDHITEVQSGNTISRKSFAKRNFCVKYTQNDNSSSNQQGLQAGYQAF